MDKRKQKLIDLIVVLIITLISLPIMAFCLGNGGTLGGAWNCAPRITQSGAEKPEYAVFKLNYGEKQSVYSIYINFSRVENTDDELSLIFDFTDSEEMAKSTSHLGITRRQTTVKNASEKSYRFIKAVEKANQRTSFARICLKQNVSVNEILFLDKDGNSIKAEFFGAITWKNDKYGFYEKSEIKGVSSADCSVDARYSIHNEQSIENLGVKQAELLTAVTSFLNGDGAGVSSSHAPLGVIITSIGVLIFGAGLFGLNFMNYVALLSTLILLYFAGKKVFNDFKFGIATVAVCLISGLPISAAIASAASTLALPFIIGAFLLAYEYLMYPVKNSAKIAVAGVLFSIAFAIDVHSIVAFLGLAVICVLGIKREIAAFSNYDELKGLNREYAREKYIKRTTLVIIRAVCCFLILPFLTQILTCGLAFFSYANYYAELNGNVFAIFAKNTSALFSARTGDETLIFGWLIGLGGENAKYYGDNVTKITANPFAMLLGAIAVVFVIVLVCLYKSKNELAQKAFSKNKYESVLGALVLSLAFVSCFISLLIFGFFGAYQTYLYAAAAFCFAVPLSFKYLCAVNEKTAYYSLSVSSVFAFIFEVIFFTEIFGLNFFPSIAQVIFTFKF